MWNNTYETYETAALKKETIKEGELVIWINTIGSNKVWDNDIAVKLVGDRKYLGLYGSVKGLIFYETCRNYRKLTHEEEQTLFFKMREE